VRFTCRPQFDLSFLDQLASLPVEEIVEVLPNEIQRVIQIIGVKFDIGF
jgi:hypothetical protein